GPSGPDEQPGHPLGMGGAAGLQTPALSNPRIGRVGLLRVMQETGVPESLRTPTSVSSVGGTSKGRIVVSKLISNVPSSLITIRMAQAVAEPMAGHCGNGPLRCEANMVLGRTHNRP